jgi:hypothetical protein
MIFVQVLKSLEIVHMITYFSVILIGNKALQHWLRAMYSASVELSAISVCSLLDHQIGTPTETMIDTVRDRQESRKRAYYWCHNPMKSLSQYASRDRFLFGFMISGLSYVHCRKYIIRLTAFSCRALFF